MLGLLVPGVGMGGGGGATLVHGPIYIAAAEVTFPGSYGTEIQPLGPCAIELQLPGPVAVEINNR